jgi:hypothetical protein
VPVAAVSLRRQHLSVLTPELLHSARIATPGRVITAFIILDALHEKNAGSGIGQAGAADDLGCKRFLQTRQRP